MRSAKLEAFRKRVKGLAKCKRRCVAGMLLLVVCACGSGRGAPNVNDMKASRKAVDAVSRYVGGDACLSQASSSKRARCSTPASESWPQRRSICGHIGAHGL